MTRLEKVILQELKLDSFVLFGHSFGGYLAGKLAARNKEKMIKLFLSSPAGVGNYPLFDFDEDIKERKEKREELPADSVLWILKKGWDQGLTPFNLLRKVGPFGTESAIKAAIRSRMPALSEKEKETLGTYLP